MKPYFSILICDHGPIVNVYANGLELGVIKNGSFEADPLLDRRNPFKTRDGLVNYLLTIVAALETSQCLPQ